MLDDLLVLGELGLDGTVRSVRGVLAAAMLARAIGMRGIIVPDPCAAEAEVVERVAVHPVSHLGRSSLPCVVNRRCARRPLAAPLCFVPPPSTWLRFAARRHRREARARREVGHLGYSYEGAKIGQGRDKALAHLDEHPAVQQQLRDALINQARLAAVTPAPIHSQGAVS